MLRSFHGLVANTSVSSLHFLLMIEEFERRSSPAEGEVGKQAKSDRSRLEGESKRGLVTC